MIRIPHVAKWSTSCPLSGYPTAEQIIVCVVEDRSDGDAGVIIAGYVGGVCVGLVLERYE